MVISFILSLQAICDSECRFVDVGLEFAGGTNDYHAFKYSVMYASIRARIPRDYYLFGDPAYPLAVWLVTSFTGVGIGNSKDDFNFFHSYSH